MTVIGVVGDVRQDSPAEKPGPTLYMPIVAACVYGEPNQIHIVLRTQVPPLTLMNAVREKIVHTNPQIALRFTTMDAMVNESMTTERFRAALVSSFAGVGLLLAMLGVYGTMAYSVAQRTFEIGIRMAFGAEKAIILRAVLQHAAKLACCGIAHRAGAEFSRRTPDYQHAGWSPSLDPVSLGHGLRAAVRYCIGRCVWSGMEGNPCGPNDALRAD